MFDPGSLVINGVSYSPWWVIAAALIVIVLAGRGFMAIVDDVLDAILRRKAASLKTKDGPDV